MQIMLALILAIVAVKMLITFTTTTLEKHRFEKFTQYALAKKASAKTAIENDRRLSYGQRLSRIQKIDAQMDRITRIAESREPLNRKINQIEWILERY